MRAWTVRTPGHFGEALELASRPVPAAPAGTAVVRVLAAGVNFQDTLLIAGRYQVRPEPPFVPGFELVGEVVEVGGPATGLAGGDRVLAFVDSGAYAPYAVVDPRRCVPPPAGMPDEEAAAVLLSFQTAYFALAHRASLGAGETLLVHAGAGGLGSAAIQLGRALGARVIATAGSPEKRALCRELGAEAALDYHDEGLAAAVSELTGGAGVDVVLDPVGGDAFDGSLPLMAWEGRILPVGFAGGRVQKIAAHRILLKNIAVVGLHWSEYWDRGPELVRQAQDRLNRLFDTGEIRPSIGLRGRLEDLPAALDAIERRALLGKAVLLVGGRAAARPPRPVQTGPVP